MSEPDNPTHIHAERRGTGKPLLLVHGLGSSWRSWDLVMPELTTQREVIAIDLPGFGSTPPLEGEVSIATLCDAVSGYMKSEGLTKVDMAGSSMGARMVIELARRGLGGTTVSLAPGGFWSPAQKKVFGASVKASIALVRALQPVLPALVGNPVGRSALLAQFSARPWALPPELALTELRGYDAAPALDAALRSLVKGPDQRGTPAGSLPGRLVIGWGRQDKVLLPRQPQTALARFPDAELHWFERCGHFPQWDQPRRTVELILRCTA